MNASASVSLHTVVSEEEWLPARRKLVKQEKQLTTQQQRVAAARRELPWVKVTRDYVFDAPEGTRRLADLFDGRSQLIVKHNMLNPTNDVCIGCSLEMDAIEKARVHLEHHDVSIVAVSRAPLAKIVAAQQRMDYGTAPVTVEDLSWFSVFYVFLDMTPKGRNETRRGNLTDWVRPHNRHDVPGSVDPVGQFMGQGGCCHEA